MAYYDDRDFDYDQFWRGRAYEHESEILALERLLGERRLGVVADIGGGFGRLSAWLTKRSDQVYLIEPSAKMRRAAEKFLDRFANIQIKFGTVQATGLADTSVDLALLVRVMHHLPNPAPALAEANRILKPAGVLVLEFANSIHLKARLKSWLTRKPILPLPVERRSAVNIAAETIPFVNHHPLTVLKQLKLCGFKVVRILSASNLRHKVLKSLIPLSILLDLESFLQTKLSRLYFGPSVWIMAIKVDK